MRAGLRGLLAAAPDFLRALARLAVDRGGPRDLAALREGWRAGAAAAALLERAPDAPAEVTRAYAALAKAEGPLGAEIEAALADELPLDKRDGGFVKPGYSVELDEARRLRDDSRRVIVEMETRYAAEAGAKLKIKHNNFLGFFIEATQALGETLLKAPHAQTFIHRQTMQGAMRFTTEALIELESRIASAADRALKLELDVFEALKRSALAASDVSARPRRGARRTRRRREPRGARGQARVDAAAGRRLARLRHRGREASGRRGGAGGGAASPSSPTTATSPARTARAAASPSSPAPTWRANRPICGRTR